MAKPGIVFYNRVYPPMRGASGRVLRELAHAFAEAGWAVTVVTSGSRRGMERDGPVRVIRVKGGERIKGFLGYTLIWIKLLLTGLRQPKTDLMVTLSDPPMLVVAGRMMASLKKMHHIHWCHDLYPDLLPSLGVHLPEFWMNILRKISRKSMKSCDRVVVVGRCMARTLLHRGLDPKKITVIPNWPDRELVDAKDAQASAGMLTMDIGHVDGARPFEEQLQDGNGPKFRVLYSGNLGRAHPLQTILDAARILVTDHKEIEFVFVGDGPVFDRLAQERSKRGMENIRLLPYQPASHLRPLMESGDIHLVTMRHEAAGLLVPCKFYSALAAGRPCVFVGSEEAEPARIIKDFKAGTVIAQGDGDKLAEVILAYRKNEDMWFGAHEGASEAGKVFVPDESINAWLDRAADVAGIVPGSYKASMIVRKKAA